MTTQNGLYRHDLPLREIVGNEIRSRIFSGTFPPGARLIERDLAAEFDVSRFPVREAIRILHREGLVETLPTRGIVVKRLERREVEEIFDIREALEGLASKLAAERVAAGEHSDLQKYVDQSRSALADDNPEAARVANSEFHDQIIEFSGSSTLHDILTPLMGRLHWLFGQVPNLDAVCNEHSELCAAINSGDPKAAAEEAQRHVLSYRNQTLEHLFG
ncbi:GntR family transcriptional regulator [Arthrobacter sp. H5]|uniref:GntR family transcriptional regulator n=1 Tax=Arthrobacter sp. H5 TaxID=1267973 RepID=UPI0004AE5EDB|nr:GntR family transcriptional regulator [Arthrobacter sp. H5]